MATKVTMPQLGESVVEGTIGKWLVEEGQRVEKDAPLVEILTDKADTEVPAPIAGVLVKKLVAEDEVVPVGSAIAEIDETAVADAGPAERVQAKKNGAEAGIERNSETRDLLAEEAAQQRAATDEGTARGEALTSPAVRKLAREQGVDVGAVRGTGPAGRVTKKDVLRAAEDTQKPARSAAPPPARDERPAPAAREKPATAPQIADLRKGPMPKSGPYGAFQLPAYTPRPGDEVVPFSRRRRIIADHMVYSKMVSPDVVTFAECDLHATTKLRDAHKDRFKKEGLGLTFLAFVADAVARALREHPDLNARVLEESLVRLGDVNLGIAVDTPEGLVVPVVKKADELTIRGLARAIDDVALRARDGKLTPDDLANKTFTISNPGRKGNLVGGAIISQPNVAILRMGTIKKRVVVVEKDDEDLLAIHPMMHMALTYDHRVVDGVMANSFLFRVVEILEAADFNV